MGKLYGFNEQERAEYLRGKKDQRAGKRQSKPRKRWYRKGRSASGTGGGVALIAVATVLEGTHAGGDYKLAYPFDVIFQGSDALFASVEDVETEGILQNDYWGDAPATGDRVMFVVANDTLDAYIIRKACF